MDFYKIREQHAKNGTIELYPDFQVVRSKDLMVRGGAFYAIWDEEKGLWSTDEYDVQRLVDKELWEARDERARTAEGPVRLRLMSEFSSKSWMQYRSYIKNLSNNYHQLDSDLTFANTPVKKTDYVSKRLPYALEEGDISAWDELVGVLYNEENRAKIEWAIGAVISGDSKYIQKFLVFYGAQGKGKSTILNIIAKLTEGYNSTFEAKALTSNGGTFAMEVLKENPLVAIQQDGDLSKIEDNTRLNSIVSHEEMVMNEKHKSAYTIRLNTFLFMGTNKPVKITDAKSGIIRRLIDVQPTGDTLPPKKYQALYSQIDFQLGAIAYHCLQVYRKMGKDYYAGYKPVEMMLQTDVFFNYIEAYYDLFKSQDGVSLKQAYELYKTYCLEANVEYKLAQYKFREELKNYFGKFEDRAVVNGERVRSYYSEFQTDRFKVHMGKVEHALPLILEHTDSVVDTDLADQPAQYATINETPIKKWADVTTTLKDLDTTQLHYVKPPLNHIVIDFDLRDEHGNKSPELNLAAAAEWPSTYAEYSKGGGGIHLHYIYDGDPTELSRVYKDGIEIKVFVGDSSLRRKLSLCNNLAVATISGGLPKKEKKLIDEQQVKSEKALRDLIIRNLNKEIHPGTKPSVDFIHKILEDAYNSDLVYDVTDMRSRILAFAAGSTNQALQAIKTVQSMKFASEKQPEEILAPEDEPITFFDLEVFPNLFVCNWKYEGTDRVVRMINPTPAEIEPLLRRKLVGFNNRKYDNHILYAAFMGYSNEQLYKLSKKIIDGVPNSTFGEAYGISYTDIYDYTSKKQSLKKYQLELGLAHKELGLPWDEPVPEEKWELVAEYCDNDVLTTEAVHNARKADFQARLILAELSGLTPNHTTQQHTARIIFEGDKNPQSEFVYTDLSELFPGYKFDPYATEKSTYRGKVVGEGGYVYAEPGMYTDVVELDIASMHPTSIEELNLFGPYTKNFSDLKSARIAIKHNDYEAARSMLGGALAPYLGTDEEAEALSYALKIVINIVYGLTAASFENPFRDPRNVDNIVAKRGALFMVELQHEVEARGFKVVHIKTDSIKIANATKEIIEFVMEFGEKYGYSFEHEGTFDRICLVNDAVYIAKTKPGRKPAHWKAVGAQFQHPYVFKKLFTKEPIEFNDLCETKTVTTSLWLDFDAEDPAMALAEDKKIFVGRAGSFVPVKAEKGGGILLREKDGKFHAATGTTGYRWMEAETLKALGKEKDVDLDYFNGLCDKAVETISKYGDFEWFVAG